jgi:type VI secretion system (T6SS) phospholipase Tle1-like effector
MTMTGAPSDKASNQSVDSGPLAERPARNIVLLSDGTGNSAAKLNKTNIWRLYQALDLSGEDQIAFYDDGVGTSGIRPLRLFGGGFGWGLSRNIRDLYRFLCRHYRPGDRIYLFGFSRGAFTVRTVAALIAKCGVLDGSKQVPGSRGRRLQLNTREGLEAGVELAYQSYRRGYSAPLTDLWRWLRDGFRPCRRPTSSASATASATFASGSLASSIPSMPSGCRSTNCRP